MAKVMVCISNSILIGREYRIACFYEQFIEALKECGNEVLVFEPNRFNVGLFCTRNNLKNKNEEPILRERIKKFNPELIISFNGVNYDKILQITNCPIVLWDADLEIFWNQQDLIKNNLDRYTYFAFSKNTIPRLQKIFGFKDEQCFEVRSATNLKRKDVLQDKNISFIGSHFGRLSDDVSDIINNHSQEKDFMKIMERLKNNPIILQDELFEGISDETLKEEFGKVDEGLYSFIYSFENRMQTLWNVHDLGLYLYGIKENWQSLTPILPSLTSCFVREHVYTAKHNEDIYNSSKICLSISHGQSINGMPWRIPDVMATNGCLISSYSPFLKQETQKYLDVPMFTNSFEARELCQKLLKDDTWRKEIVEASNRLVDAEYRWEKRFKQMEDILKLKLIDDEKTGNVDVLQNQFPIKFRKDTLKNKIRMKIYNQMKKTLSKKGLV